jgi:hypothetical protein
MKGEASVKNVLPSFMKGKASVKNVLPTFMKGTATGKKVLATVMKEKAPGKNVLPTFMKEKAPGKNVLASFKKGKGLRKNVLPLLFLTNPFVTKTYVGFRRSWLETRTKIEISNWFLLEPVNRQKVKNFFLCINLLY